MAESNKKKAFVAMSGGVDSSVAALLLKNQGYSIVGVFMKCWSGDSRLSTSLKVNCAWERDSEDARRVAGHIGIPFYVWDFEEEYKKKVVEYMVEGYRSGITPNPDVMCNKEIKFGLFLNKALALGADYVATGHYVSKEKNVLFVGTRFGRSTPTYVGVVPCLPAGRSQRRPLDKLGDQARLLRGFEREHFSLYTVRDQNKDQSYFLWTLTQKQLKHCLFPIGDYVKSEVREMAREAGLPTAEKKDSQGICFLGKVTLADFLKTYIPRQKGAVVNTLGEKVGEHEGAHFYTIGQRHGLNHKTWNMKHETLRHRDPKPFYVAEKNVNTNTIVVVEGDDSPALYRKEVKLANVNFLSPQHSNILKNVRMSVLARVRYRQPLAKAKLMKHETWNMKHKLYRLVFDVPQKFVAAGQSAVFYKTGDPSASSGLELLGGGIILNNK